MTIQTMNTSDLIHLESKRMFENMKNLTNAGIFINTVEAFRYTRNDKISRNVN